MGAPFRRRLLRVGMAVADLEEARRRFAYALGAEIPDVIESVDESDLTSASDWMRDEGRFVVFEIGALQLVLVESPDGGAMPNDRIHHLSFETDELDQSLDSLQSMGANLIAEGATEANQRFALVDGRTPLSCYLELLEGTRNTRFPKE